VAVCFAQSVSQTAADRSQDERFLKAFLQDFLRGRVGGGDEPVRYSHAWVSLRSGRKRDAIVYLQGPGWCGSGGCVALVLSREQSAFRVVTWITVAQLPIRVLANKSNGWKSIGVWVQGGGVQPGYEAELRFDGSSYPTNPSISPAVRLAGRAVGEAVITSSSERVALYP
jgi:hypothetical protein